MKVFLNLLGLVLLTACATDPAVLNDPAFRAGYETGCGMAAADPKTKSAMLDGQPELYRRGFNSGVSACDGAREVGY